MFAYGIVNDISGYYMLDTGASAMVLFDSVQNLPEIEVEDNTMWMLGKTFESSWHILSKVQLGESELEGEFQAIQPPEELRSTFS